MDPPGEIGRLPVVPPARKQGYARAAAGARAISIRPIDAWQRRLQSGQAGADMLRALNQLGPKRALALFADWTDRIAAGEVPPTPPRPQGIERNVVITEWDWAHPKGYLHDEVSTDRRNPTLNPNGLIYGSMELSADYLPVLDPVNNKISQVELTVRDPRTPAGRRSDDDPAVAILGSRSAVEQQEQRPQPDVRRPGPALDHVGGPACRQPRLLQAGFEPPVSQAVSDRACRAGTSPCTTRRPASSRTSAPVSGPTT